VLPVPKRNLAIYRRIAARAGTVGREYGALEYVECAGDDVNVKKMGAFPKRIRARPGETVVFS
jgi:uncharacterized protein YbaA (DUF1428 family)